jgi:hypothetical protein
MKTNYEEYFESKMQDPEFKVQYLLAKEKLDMELMIDSIKEGIKQNKSQNTIFRRINKLSKHIHNFNVI